jgi:F0F1-type ATP synthase membrane subunit b/b'
MEAFLKNLDLVPLDLAMILLWAVLFVVFWKLLEKFLFAPYLALGAARSAATVELEAQAQKNSEEAAILLKDYEAKIAEERVLAIKQQISSLNEAKGSAASIIAEAEKNSEHYLKQVRKEINGQLSVLRESAFQDVDSLARMIVEKAKAPVGPRTSS